METKPEIQHLCGVCGEITTHVERSVWFGFYWSVVKFYHCDTCDH